MRVRNDILKERVLQFWHFPIRFKGDDPGQKIVNLGVVHVVAEAQGHNVTKRGRTWLLTAHLIASRTPSPLAHT